MSRAYSSAARSRNGIASVAVTTGVVITSCTSVLVTAGVSPPARVL
jgi:hypothetical protein